MPSGVPTLQVHDGHFAERLFQARRAQGYSREEIEQLTEKAITARSLMRWETNPETQPRLGVGMRRLAEILGVTLPWLFWGDKGANGKDARE